MKIFRFYRNAEPGYLNFAVVTADSEKQARETLVKTYGKVWGDPTVTDCRPYPDGQTADIIAVECIL